MDDETGKALWLCLVSSHVKQRAEKVRESHDRDAITGFELCS